MRRGLESRLGGCEKCWMLLLVAVVGVLQELQMVQPPNTVPAGLCSNNDSMIRLKDSAERGAVSLVEARSSSHCQRF